MTTSFRSDLGHDGILAMVLLLNYGPAVGSRQLPQREGHIQGLSERSMSKVFAKLMQLRWNSTCLLYTSDAADE